MAPTFFATLATAAPVETACEVPAGAKVSVALGTIVGVRTTTLVLVIKLDGTVMLLLGLMTGMVQFAVPVAYDQLEEEALPVHVAGTIVMVVE